MWRQGNVYNHLKVYDKEEGRYVKGIYLRIRRKFWVEYSKGLTSVLLWTEGPEGVYQQESRLLRN